MVGASLSDHDDTALVKLGRTVALCDVEVSQAGALVAKGLFTYLLLDKGEKGTSK